MPPKRALEKGKRKDSNPPHQQQHPASSGVEGVKNAKSLVKRSGGCGLETGLDEGCASEDDDPDE